MNNELYHHGVLGMRWSRRRGEGTVKVTRKQLKQAQKAAKEEANKKIKSMTNEELKARVDRMNLEKQYRQAMSENHPNKNRAKKLIGSIANRSLEDIGTQATSYALGTILNEVTGSKVVDPTKMQKGKK